MVWGALALVEFQCWMASFLISCQQNLEDQDCELCSLISCWFSSKVPAWAWSCSYLFWCKSGTALTVIERLFLPSQSHLSVCARPGCVRGCLRHGGLLLATSIGEKEACERWKSQSRELCLITRNPSNKWSWLKRAGALGRHRLSVQNHYWLLHSGLVLISGK